MKYHDLDDDFFQAIDSEAKAYLLGWIASDAAITKGTIALYVHRRDAQTLSVLRDIVCRSLPIRTKKPVLAGFTINSVRIVADVCRWLAISPGKKATTVGFPELHDDRLSWAFVRGYFEGDGSIGSIDAALKRATKGWPSPRCSIASTSDRLLDAIAAFTRIPAHRAKGALEWYGTNALDFLDKIYRDATCYLPRKRDLFLDWCCWLPSLGGGRRHGVDPLFRWAKTLPNAVPPAKEFASDSGFDVTLIERGRRHGNVEFFRTGIRVQPAFGWYFDLVARSSITKTGYMLANAIGVIDRAYVGEVLVPLVKIDPAAPDLPLPARVVQLIPRPIVTGEVVEVAELEGTARGSGGFGSTG